MRSYFEVFSTHRTCIVVFTERACFTSRAHTLLSPVPEPVSCVKVFLQIEHSGKRFFNNRTGLHVERAPVASFRNASALADVLLLLLFFAGGTIVTGVCEVIH